MMKKYHLAAMLLTPWLFLASAPAIATAVWTSGTGACNTDGALYTSCAVTPNGGSGGTTLAVSAISDTGAFASGSGNYLASAYIGYYSANHFGVTSKAGLSTSSTTVAGAAHVQESQSSPQHAMDNEVNQEFMLYNFGSAVTLSQVKLGWSSNDSDITVLAYKGAGAPVLTTGSTTYGGAANGLLAKGWVVVGNYYNVCSAANGGTCSGGSGIGTAVISTIVSSSYWLIGALNSLGGTNGTSDAGAGGSTGYDYVKVLSVAGSTPPPGGQGQVPEPSSLLLMGLALASLTVLRRRQTS